jgi:glycosyltransferase involved in cell wall biosynthesis
VNVLILNHEFPPVGGGAGTATIQIARELATLGVSITVMTSAYANLPKTELRDGYTIHRVPAWRKDTLESHPHEIISYLVSVMAKSTLFCIKNRPNLIHTFFGIPAGIIGYTLKQVLGSPYLISFRGRDVHGGKDGITGLMKTVSLPIWHKANACVANSDGLRQIAQRISPKLDVGVIPNGIDTQRFYPSPESTNTIKKLLYVGRLEPYKGLDVLLKALANIQNEPWHLQMVGDGSLRHELPKLAQELNISDRVTFEAHPPDKMPSVYQQADLFVLPSIVEGMSNAVLEAMASGLPIVATRIPGSEELITDGKNGLLVQASAKEPLSNALSTLLKSSNLRQTLGHNARLDAEKRSWRSVAESYLTLYNEIDRKTASCVASSAS